jgi:hypothetical protein
VPPSPPNRRTDNAKTRAEKGRAWRQWLRERKRLRRERREQYAVEIISDQEEERILTTPGVPEAFDEAFQEIEKITPDSPIIHTDPEHEMDLNKLKYDGSEDVHRGNGLDIADSMRAQGIPSARDFTPPFKRDFTPPFKCEQTKREDGWHVLDSNGRSAGKAKSRSAQRQLRDELNGAA